MLLTVHRWFAATACPGTWMMEHMADLAEKVTAKLGGKAETPVAEPVAANKSEDPEKQIWDFLMGKIGNAYGAAGLMGELFAESGCKPDNLQNSYNKKLNITDEEYTRLVDGGNYPDFVTDKAGYGLAQWTFWSRKRALLDYARAKGKSIGDLQMQLDFLWKELNDSYPAVLNVLRGARSVREASDAVLLWYERPADQGEAVQKKRAEYGERYYAQYGQSGESVVVPFLVKAGNVIIRTGPGEGYPMTGRTGNGVFTVVEVKDGWGKLKSGAGWVELAGVKKVKG